MDSENALFDEGVGPDQIEEFALGNQTPGVTDQHQQNFVSLRFEGNRLASSQEAPFVHVQHELREFVNFSPVNKTLSES
jgi:GMP synthase-like glutamine amidotransferase